MVLRDLVNPVSTAATEWWCHSALRNLLLGNGLHRTPRPTRRDLIRSQDGFIPLSPSAYADDDVSGSTEGEGRRP